MLDASNPGRHLTIIRGARSVGWLQVKVIVGIMGVVGDFQVHEPIGVTTVVADTAMPAPSRPTALPSIDTMTMAIYDTIHSSDVPMSLLFPQAT